MASAKSRKCDATNDAECLPKELRPNSHMLPSRTEPNIRPNFSAELRRLPNFGPSLVQTAFVSLFYIFINMKPWNASNSSVVVVDLLLIMQISKLCHWKTTPTRAFNEFLYDLENSLKFANFFCWGNEFSIYDMVQTPLTLLPRPSLDQSREQNSDMFRAAYGVADN